MDVRTVGQHSVPTPPGNTSANTQSKHQGRGITALPSELIEKVFANLDGRDLIACQRVVKAWHNVIATSPLLACAFYRRYHPLSHEPRLPLPRGISNSYRETLGWLTRFSQGGSELALKLSAQLARGHPRYFRQILFFTTAQVLAQAKAFDHCYPCSINCPETIRFTLLSPDQRHLLVAAVDDDSLIINRRSNGWWQKIATIGHRGEFNRDRFSPSGDYFIANGRDNSIQIWETFAEQWRIQTTFPNRGGYPACISPNEDFLALHGVDHTLQISQQINGQWQKPAPVPDSNNLSGFTFSPLEDILVTRHGRKTIKCWRLVEQIWQLYTTIQAPWRVQQPRFNPAGRTLFVASLDYPILTIYQRTDQGWANRWILPFDNPLHNLSFSPKGDHFVAGHSTQIGSPIDIEHTVTLWRFSDNGWYEVSLLNATEFRHACFSPVGDRLLIVSMDQTITLWRDVAGQWQQEAMLPHLNKVTSACFSPHGYLAIASANTVTIWGMRAGQWRRKADLAHDAKVQNVTFSFDGQCIVTQHVGAHIANIWTLSCK